MLNILFSGTPTLTPHHPGVGSVIHKVEIAAKIMGATTTETSAGVFAVSFDVPLILPDKFQQGLAVLLDDPP